MSACQEELAHVGVAKCATTPLVPTSAPVTWATVSCRTCLTAQVSLGVVMLESIYRDAMM